MSPSMGPHHKIYGWRLTEAPTTFGHDRGSFNAGEAGYTLVALLAVMTLLALFAMAAAPSIRQQVQREREKEAIFRGEQVAEAIRDYYKYRHAQGLPFVQALPTSIDQLLEGIPVTGGSKKRQVLRASSAKDPLSTSAEWRLIRAASQDLIEFQRSVMLYAGNIAPTPKDTQIAELQRFAAPQITSVLNTGSTETAPGGEDSAADSTGPFVGVSSRSKNNSVLYYYGIDRHDQWIFTPLFK
jgi:type II secretory pathway pseudopilin PulG